ncbi:MAG: tetratricopeptide repeat protein [Nitrosopumilus sp.]|nr:tetratricopeptide repeat protein [Nitrosopumilus sp.]
MLGIVLGISLVLTVLSPVILTDAFADSFDVIFDKEIYASGDTMSLSGEIFDITMPVIAMSIYDPDGKILSANNLEITSENTFSKTISFDSPSYEKPGEYLVKFAYAQETKNYNFSINGEVDEPEILQDENQAPEIVLLYTEKKQYNDKDVIEITGLVSKIDSPTVLIGIHDPFGMPAGFYFGTINSDLEFSTSFLVKDGVNFRTEGTYSVKAHYAESEATSFFEYSKVPQIIEDDTTTDETDDADVNDEQTTNEDDANQQTTNDDTNEQTTNHGTNQQTTKEDTNEQASTNDNTNKKESSINNPSSIINDSPKINPEQTKSNKNTVTKTAVDEKSIIQTNTVNEKPSVEKNNKKENNLSVEDVELGLLLNQIRLECDTSAYTDTISYYDGMGPALYRLCQFESSLNFFNESLINNPNDLEILVNKGSTLGKLGYLTEAIAYYDQAINIDSDFLPAKNNKANALANLGNFKDAIVLYDEILEKNPNYQTARKNLNIALSSSIDTTNSSPEIDIQKISYQEPSISEKSSISNSETEKPSSFFDEVGLVISNFGSLLGFLN